MKEPPFPEQAPAGAPFFDMNKGPFRTRLSHYDPIRFDDNRKDRETRIVNPYLDFRTDTAAMKAFRTMLSIMLKQAFSYAYEYDGPPLGLSDETREMVPIEDVLEALEDKDGARVPLMGLRCTMVYDHDGKVIASLKVKGRGRSRVRLRIKGTLLKSSWNHLRSHVKRRFHVEV